MKFMKKRDMIDVGELQKQGKIMSPSKRIDIPTDKNGFVEISPEIKYVEKKEDKSLREINNKLISRIEELDKNIFRLEQRVELLEKKLGIDNSMPHSINW